MLHGRWQWIWGGLILGGCIFRLVSGFQHPPTDYLFSDPLRHWLNGERLWSPDLMGASDPILYQVWIALVRTLSWDQPLIIAGICVALSLLMPWLFYRAARELGLRKTSSLAVWALVASAPSLVTIYHYFMMETLLLPLVGLALWMTARSIRKQTPASLLWAVTLWTLACLTKPTVVPLAIVCVGWSWLAGPRRIADAALASLILALLLVPNTLRTTSHLGFASPLGNPWLTKIQHRSGARTIRIEFGEGNWVFSSPSCYIYPLEPLSSWTLRRAREDSVVNVSVEPSGGVSDWRDRFQSIDTTFSEWIAQLGENVVLFLFAPSWPDSNVREWDGWLSHVTRWMWAPLIFVVLECNVREFVRREFRLLPVAVTAFTLFLAFQNVATTEGRYRKPLEPLLLLNAVWVFAPARERRP